MHPQVLLFLILKAKESFKNTNKEAVEKKTRLSKGKRFCINLHNCWAPGYLCFLFLLQYIHSSLTEVVLPLPPVSIFDTVSLYVEVTPVIDMNGQ